MVDLLVLTSSDMLLFKLKILFTCVTKQTTLRRRSTVLSLPLQLVFPALTYGYLKPTANLSSSEEVYSE
jgi:hypothetical protein